MFINRFAISRCTLKADQAPPICPVSRQSIMLLSLMFGSHMLTICGTLLVGQCCGENFIGIVDVTSIVPKVLNSWPCELSSLVPKPYEMGRWLADFVDLKFRKLWECIYTWQPITPPHMVSLKSLLGEISSPTLYHNRQLATSSHSLVRSVHLLCTTIVSSSWLPRDHVRHIVVTWYADSAHMTNFTSVTFSWDKTRLRQQHTS